MVTHRDKRIDAADVAVLAWIAHTTGRDLQRAARSVGGAATLVRQSGAQLARTLGLDGALSATLGRERRGFDGLQAVVELEARGISTHTPQDSSLGVRLHQLFDPPFGLFAVGQLRDDLEVLLSRPTVAIVGSRRATPDGMAFARSLAEALSYAGATIVSGLAQGIDRAAHEGSLDGDGGALAVLGCGVDVQYPRANRDLRRRLAQSGALLSEYWPETSPAPWRFPARNRIVAALSDITVVVEASARSGALITADFALEMGRPVLAVPGRAGSPHFAGCHALLRAGAGLCETVDDVVAELPNGDWHVAEPTRESLEGVPARVYAEIVREPSTPDVVATRLGLPIAEVAGVLALLELEGLATRSGGRFTGLPVVGASR